MIREEINVVAQRRGNFYFSDGYERGKRKLLNVCLNKLKLFTDEKLICLQ